MKADADDLRAALEEKLARTRAGLERLVARDPGAAGLVAGPALSHLDAIVARLEALDGAATVDEARAIALQMICDVLDVESLSALAPVIEARVTDVIAKRLEQVASGRRSQQKRRARIKERDLEMAREFADRYRVDSGPSPTALAVAIGAKRGLSRPASIAAIQRGYRELGIGAWPRRRPGAKKVSREGPRQDEY